MGTSVRPMTAEQIRAASLPPGQGGQTTRGVLYDTLALPVAGPAGGTLTFYQQNTSDLTISNVKNGRLAQGYGFIIRAYSCDIDLVPSVGDNTAKGALTDMATILKVNRPIVILTRNNTTFFPIPLTFCHASGGEVGGLAATLTAPNSLQYANNGVFSGGFQLGGSIALGDQQPFAITIQFAQPFTAYVGGPINVRFNMIGDLTQPTG